MMRLDRHTPLPATVQRPGYDPRAHGTGIVHLGLGAFHKAHQAVMTDDALAAAGGDWRILGVSLRSAEPAAELTPQDGRYTVIARDAGGTRARVIGAISGAACLAKDRDRIAAALAAGTTRIVSLTVTEKGYGIDRATGGIDRTHPAIAHDLAHPEAPIGVAGLLVQAIARRRARGIPPFTVLSCDNLPGNGAMVRGLLSDFARSAAPDLVAHIEGMAFPATMVDRITPARTQATLDLARELTGAEDRAAVETEGFTQWVIEDDFPTGRPAWEAGGAIFVADVAPYEEMKLRMLNGAHSMLAYAGFLSGREFVRDVMADPALAPLVARHIRAAAATLAPLPGVDFAEYGAALLRRFRNPHLAHATFQIAMDGTEKLPQRILAPAAHALAQGQPLRPFAFATAAWMRYALGRTDAGATYPLRDPREARIADALRGRATAREIADALHALPGLFPDTLATSPDWRGEVVSALAAMLSAGMPAAVRSEAARLA